VSLLCFSKATPRARLIVVANGEEMRYVPFYRAVSIVTAGWSTGLPTPG
jgi:hypothetical protein